MVKNAFSVIFFASMAVFFLFLTCIYGDYGRSHRETNRTASEKKRNTIKVRITDNQSHRDVFDEVRISSQGNFVVTCIVAEKILDSRMLFWDCIEEADPEMCDTEIIQAKESFSIHKQEIETNQILIIESDETFPLCLDSIHKDSGIPDYFGRFILYSMSDGIVVINEVDLEEYLRGVVPSEMPAEYPQEALKAQAVCARTCARNHINEAVKADRIEDLNDTVSYQVYNNYPPSKTTSQAVKETTGEVIQNKHLQYYSTAWNRISRNDCTSEAAFQKFISRMPDHNSEYQSVWQRWIAVIDKIELIQSIGFSDPSGSDFQIQGIKRRKDGQIQSLMIKCGIESVSADTEYDIRKLFASGMKVYLMDGTIRENMQLLPSAYIRIINVKDTKIYHIVSDAFFQLFPEEMLDELMEQLPEHPLLIFGGGYGHGNGMSQSGCAQMASEGYTYREILKYYYDTDIIHTI